MVGFPVFHDDTSGNINLTKLTVSAISPAFAFYIICLFDIAGVMFGVCKIANLVNKDGGLNGAKAVFACCGVGSVIAPILGCTPVIALGESFAGVIVGGRTGIVPIVMGICFLLSLPFYPLLQSIPTFASSPVVSVKVCFISNRKKFSTMD